MKPSRLILSLLSVIALSAAGSAQAAAVPRELGQLVPRGAEEISLAGKTAKGALCSVNLRISPFGFSASAANLDHQGKVVSRTFAAFQIGLGHELQSLQSSDAVLTAVSIKKADTILESDSRSTLIVERSADSIDAISVEVAEKGPFSWHKKSYTRCLF
jgi:hypothetical protein